MAGWLGRVLFRSVNGAPRLPPCLALPCPALCCATVAGPLTGQGLVETSGAAMWANALVAAEPCPPSPPPIAGPLTEQGLDELFRVVGDCATPHFVFARHVLPALNPEPSSSLLFISGAAGVWSAVELPRPPPTCYKLMRRCSAFACPPHAGSTPGIAQQHMRTPNLRAPRSHAPCAGERCLNADSSLYSVASSMLYGIILAAQARHQVGQRAWGQRVWL